MKHVPIWIKLVQKKIAKQKHPTNINSIQLNLTRVPSVREKNYRAKNISKIKVAWPLDAYGPEAVFELYPRTDHEMIIEGAKDLL